MQTIKTLILAVLGVTVLSACGGKGEQVGQDLNNDSPILISATNGQQTMVAFVDGQNVNSQADLQEAAKTAQWMEASTLLNQSSSEFALQQVQPQQAANGNFGQAGKGDKKKNRRRRGHQRRHRYDDASIGLVVYEGSGCVVRQSYTNQRFVRLCNQAVNGNYAYYVSSPYVNGFSNVHNLPTNGIYTVPTNSVVVTRRGRLPRWLRRRWRPRLTLWTVQNFVFQYQTQPSYQVTSGCGGWINIQSSCYQPVTMAVASTSTCAATTSCPQANPVWYPRVQTTITAPVVQTQTVSVPTYNIQPQANPWTCTAYY